MNMRIITFIGLITFIISCFLPCFSVRDSSFDYMGYTALFLGWAGVFINSELTVYYISWYANILFLISLFIKEKVYRDNIINRQSHFRMLIPRMPLYCY